MEVTDSVVENLYLDVDVKIWNNSFEVISLKLLFPEHIKCVVCNREIYSYDSFDLCPSCYDKITFLSEYQCCKKCGRPLIDHSDYNYCNECLKRYRYFDRGFSATVYDSVSEKMIFDFKYNDKTFLYRSIGDIMAECLTCDNVDYDFITYVPIHTMRRITRGFNQSKLIAERISEITGKRMINDAVVRNKNTKRLKNLTMIQRENELKGAFLANDRLDLEGTKLLLVDDIMTTGTTADRCSMVLKDMGAEEVIVVTFAVKCNYD